MTPRPPIASSTLARAVRVAIALAASTAACPARRSESSQCAYSDECAAGLVCAGGTCRAACSSDRDCTAPGTTCRPSGRPEAPRACLASDAPALCLYASDCTRPGEVCARDGVCRAECQGDRDCAVRAPWFADAVCSVTDHVCVARAPDGGAPAGPAPRLIAPLSGSVVPPVGGTVLRFDRPAPLEAVQLETCADHACTTATPAGAPTSELVIGYPTGATGIVYWRLWGLVGGRRTSTPSATWQFTVRAGLPPAVGNRGVAPRLDANHDGVPDVAVAAPYAAAGARRIYVYQGDPAPGMGLMLPLTGPTITSGTTELGASLAGAGDMDGDGNDELLASNAGLVVRFAAQPTAGFNPMSTLFFAGEIVARAGDLDGDGRDDALVGARNSGNFHAVNFRRGSSLPTGALLRPPTGASATFGNALAGAGDVDGDGFDDVIVGDPASGGMVGAAYLVRGSATGLMTAVTFQPLAGDRTAGALFGSTVAGVGDVNGDGYADVVVGDLVTSPTRRVWLFTGGAAVPGVHPGVALEVPAAMVSSPVRAIAPLGDVNRDGYADFAVSAAESIAGGVDDGRVLVFVGSASGPVLGPTLRSPMGISLSFGAAVSGPGDLDDDGFDDVVVGEPFTQHAYVFRGGGAAGLQTTMPRTIASGLAGSEGFGTSIAP